MYLIMIHPSNFKGNIINCKTRYWVYTKSYYPLAIYRAHVMTTTSFFITHNIESILKCHPNFDATCTDFVKRIRKFSRRNLETIYIAFQCIERVRKFNFLTLVQHITANTNLQQKIKQFSRSQNQKNTYAFRSGVTITIWFILHYYTCVFTLKLRGCSSFLLIKCVGLFYIYSKRVNIFGFI